MADFQTALIDCHHHIYDARWPVDPRAVLSAPPKDLDDYVALKTQLSIDRSVVIQPSTYGYDNSGLVEAIERLGRDRTRGVAVTPIDVSVVDLAALARAGVVALRVNMQLNQSITATADVPRLAARCAEMDWHLEINAPASLIAEYAAAWRSLPCPIVLDHMGNLPSDGLPDDAAQRAVAALVDGGRAWVKLSGPYFGGRRRPYELSASDQLVRWFVERFSPRLVWGSNWPHPTESERYPPDDAAFLSMLRDVWITRQVDRERILFGNAMQLYQFGRHG